MVVKIIIKHKMSKKSIYLKIGNSSFFIRRLMFSLCLIITIIEAVIADIAKIKFELIIKIIIGRKHAAISEARETILKRNKAIIHIKKTIPALIGDRRMKTPRLVATPFPPEKDKKIEKECPIIHAKPVTIGNQTMEVNTMGKITAMLPLMTSPKNTSNPYFQPNTRRALVAPILPLPELRISDLHVRFDITIEDGMEPSK